MQTHPTTWYKFPVMSRTEYNFQHNIDFVVEFKTVLAQSTSWTQVMDEMFIFRKDHCQESTEHDLNAVRVHKETTEYDALELAWHFLIEISRLIAGFFVCRK